MGTPSELNLPRRALNNRARIAAELVPSLASTSSWEGWLREKGRCLEPTDLRSFGSVYSGTHKALQHRLNTKGGLRLCRYWYVARRTPTQSTSYRQPTSLPTVESLIMFLQWDTVVDLSVIVHVFSPSARRANSAVLLPRAYEADAIRYCLLVAPYHDSHAGWGPG